MDRDGNMYREDSRLATFENWPSNIPVSPLHLVTAGLYYTGQGDQVKCFSCKGRIMSWEQGDVPLQEHRRHFPNCQFVNNAQASGNVHFTFGHAVSVATRNGVESRNGDDGTHFDSEMDTAIPDSRSHNAIPASDAVSTGITNGHSAQPFASSPNRDVFNQSRMVDRGRRLESLLHWPMSGRIEIDRVADHGMFYTGESDKIKCVYCNGSMINWDDGDDPVYEHDKYFGNRCTRGTASSGGNTAITRTAPDGNSATYERLNIITERPRHSQYVTEAARLESFRNWPIEDAQSKRVLVAAGFYYTGSGDQVRCFFCNIGLKNWDSSDNPLREHQKWSEKCGFLRQLQRAKEQTDGRPVEDNNLDVRAENARLKQQKTCRGCRQKDVEMVFLPCGHLLSCTDCADSFKDCPQCNTAVGGTVRAYFS